MKPKKVKDVIKPKLHTHGIHDANPGGYCTTCGETIYKDYS